MFTVWTATVKYDNSYIRHRFAKMQELSCANHYFLHNALEPSVMLAFSWARTTMQQQATCTTSPFLQFYATHEICREASASATAFIFFDCLVIGFLDAWS